MEKIKVLIADDSGVYRSMIKSVFEDAQRFEIVAAVASGLLAIEKLKTSSVDLLILDLEMPGLDGIGTLKEMVKLKIKCKTLVFTSLSKHGAQCSLEALELGASDFITKPGHDTAPGSPLEKIKNALIPTVEGLFPKTQTITKAPQLSGDLDAFRWQILRPRLIMIGSSTGGPSVLEYLFAQLKGQLTCPIIITQHMPPIFTATLAERLSRISGLDCAEAKDGEILTSNRVYIAPGDFHLRLKGTINETILTLDKGPLIQSVRPAVDPMFETAASIFKDKCLAFVLTGMGYDGRDGARAVKQHGGYVGIQEKNSCTVFGMPGAVYESGHFDMIAAPDEIAQMLREKALGFLESSSKENLSRKVIC